jgi:hypothetical protein
VAPNNWCAVKSNFYPLVGIGQFTFTTVDLQLCFSLAPSAQSRLNIIEMAGIHPFLIVVDIAEQTNFII